MFQKHRFLLGSRSIQEVTRISGSIQKVPGVFGNIQEYQEVPRSFQEFKGVVATLKNDSLVLGLT